MTTMLEPMTHGNYKWYENWVASIIMMFTSSSTKICQLLLQLLGDARHINYTPSLSCLVKYAR